MPSIQNTDEAFKKTVQVVDKPQTTDHNIMDDYVNNPPQNLDPDMGRRPGNKLKEAGRVTETPPDLGAEGRIKRSDELAEIVQEDSVHR